MAVQFASSLWSGSHLRHPGVLFLHVNITKELEGRRSRAVTVRCLARPGSLPVTLQGVLRAEHFLFFNELLFPAWTQSSPWHHKTSLNKHQMGRPEANMCKGNAGLLETACVHKTGPICAAAGQKNCCCDVKKGRARTQRNARNTSNRGSHTSGSL